HTPVADIEVMNVLLANMIPAKPNVMVPVANLLFQFGVALIAAVPDRPAIDPISAQSDHVAYRPVPDAFDGLDVTGLVAALGAGSDFEVFLFGHFSRFIHQAAGRAVNRNGLLGENVLARLHARSEMGGAETWRRGKDGVID